MNAVERDTLSARTTPLATPAGARAADRRRTRPYSKFSSQGIRLFVPAEPRFSLFRVK